MADYCYRSPYPDVEVPEVDLTTFVLEKASKFPDNVALFECASKRAYTYKQLPILVKKCAAGLAAKGFGKGSVLCIFSPNLPEFAIAFLAAATLGGASSLANPTYTPDELSKIIKDSRPKFLVTVAPLLAQAKEGIKISGLNVDEVFVFGEAPGATPFASLLSNDGKVPAVRINPREDIVALPYSSGTTGLPKGVMLTHYNIVANIIQNQPGEDKMTDGVEVFYGCLPFFHIYGLVVILLTGLRHAEKIVTVPRFELEQYLNAVQDHRVTRSHLVPPIILALAKHPIVPKFDLSSITTIFSGAAPLGGELAASCQKRLPKTVLKQGYGLTETSPVTHSNPSNAVILASIGVLLPNMQAKIVHIDSGKALPPGAANVGELWLAGPNIMKGYYNNPKATAECIDKDGYFHTGDIAYVDEKGYFYIVDRLKELIKFKGFQVAPAELEDLLLSHPAVADCAVIGVPDQEAGELPRAYVVLAAGKKATAKEIQDFVASKLSHFKHLRGGVAFVDAIPKSLSGKILRRVLRDEAVKALTAKL
eukprot:TRINITY_DN5388_c0_g1_i1.p2 TRINITY_DN5388_c0_g1~~TRINITY_DN5388_c0_g1_i1.p2  ORF type:complete len:536 (-),score=210.74 TRINITY_DN5388_c0_g1_i1:286-1893(-)